MASRRMLKKNINIICADLFGECVAVSLYSPKSNDDNINMLLLSIIKLQCDYISRVSHVEPKMKASLYFKDLIAGFNVRVNEIVDQISNLS